LITCSVAKALVLPKPERIPKKQTDVLVILLITLSRKKFSFIS